METIKKTNIFQNTTKSDHVKSTTQDKVKDNLENDTNWKEEFQKIITGRSPFDIWVLNQRIDKLIEKHGTKNMDKFIKVTKMVYERKSTSWRPRIMNHFDIMKIFDDYISLSPQQVNLITDENLEKWEEIVNTYNQTEKLQTIYFSNILKY